MTARTPPPPVDLDWLRSVAQHHRQAAHASAASASEFALVDAPIHAGAAVELLAKVLLIQLHPALIVFGADANHAVLDQVTRPDLLPDLSSRSPGARTLDASVAVELVARFCPEVRQRRKAVKNLLDARNAAVHMAEADPDPETTLATLDLFTKACLERFDAQREVLSAERVAEIESIFAARKAVVEHKVQIARLAHERLVDSFQGDDRTRLLAVLAQRADSDPGDDGWQVDCPACDAETSWLSLYVDYDQEDGYAYPSTTYVGGLNCTTCGLSLDAQEVDDLGLDVEDPRIPDYAEDYDRDRD